VLQLTWNLPPRREASTAERFLELLRVAAESRPTRFGAFEPLQGRLSSDDDAPFVALWSELLEVEHGDEMFWTSTPPFFGGSVFFPDWREDEVLESVERVIGLDLSVDGRALADERWREIIVDLFVRIADGLDAVYAAGYVEADWIAKAGRLWAGAAMLGSGYLRRRPG
jgi:hypothetical protein